MSKENKRIGRPLALLERGKAVTIYLTPSQHEKLKRLGGSRWVQNQLDKQNARTDN